MKIQAKKNLRHDFLSQISHKKAKTGYWRAYPCVRDSRFEKAFLSDFCLAVQMSPKSNCIWTAARRIGGDVSCSSVSMSAIKADSLL